MFNFSFKYDSLSPVSGIPGLLYKSSKTSSFFLVMLSSFLFINSLGMRVCKLLITSFQTNSRVLTNQKGPMAHRRWSQEQYVFKKSGVVVNYTARLFDCKLRTFFSSCEPLSVYYWKFFIIKNLNSLFSSSVTLAQISSVKRPISLCLLKNLK